MKTKSGIRKTALAALFMALMMLLGGCNLVVKDPEVDLKQTILEVNGEKTDKAHFIELYNKAYQQEYQMQLMYQQYGLIQQINIDPDQILNDTLDATAKDLLLKQKAQEAGLDVLTPEETSKVEEDGEAAYQDILTQVQDSFFQDTKLAGDELTSALAAKSEELGYPRDLFIQNAREQVLNDKLRANITKDVAVSDAEVSAEYETRLAQAKSDYTENLSAYGQAVNGGEPVYYAPAGYRYVKQVLVKFLPEDQTALDQLKKELSTLQTALDGKQTEVDSFESALAKESLDQNDQASLDKQKAALTTEEAQQYDEFLASEALNDAQVAALDALKQKTPVYQALSEAKTALDAKQAELTAAQDAAYANILPKAQEVYALAQAPGADFDALVKQYNEDTGMPETGYAICEGFASFDEAFVKPAMALKNIGDVAEPSKGIYGFYITQYAADIKEGPVALDAVSGLIHDELLETKKGEVYTTTVDEWIAAATIKKYPERIKE